MGSPHTKLSESLLTEGRGTGIFLARDSPFPTGAQLIQPVAHVTTPANILFNRYLNQIDLVPLGYNRYGFYRVDDSVTRQAIIDELQDIGFQIEFEFVEGIKGLTGAILAKFDLIDSSISDENRVCIYVYFNTNHHIILYLSSHTKHRAQLDRIWESVLEKFPVNDETLTDP